MMDATDDQKIEAYEREALGPLYGRLKDPDRLLVLHELMEVAPCPRCGQRTLLIGTSDDRDGGWCFTCQASTGEPSPKR